MFHFSRAQADGSSHSFGRHRENMKGGGARRSTRSGLQVAWGFRRSLAKRVGDRLRLFATFIAVSLPMVFSALCPIHRECFGRLRKLARAMLKPYVAYVLVPALRARGRRRLGNIDVVATSLQGARVVCSVSGVRQGEQAGLAPREDVDTFHQHRWSARQGDLGKDGPIGWVVGPAAAD